MLWWAVNGLLDIVWVKGAFHFRTPYHITENVNSKNIKLKVISQLLGDFVKVIPISYLCCTLQCLSSQNNPILEKFVHVLYFFILGILSGLAFYEAAKCAVVTCLYFLGYSPITQCEFAVEFVFICDSLMKCSHVLTSCVYYIIFYQRCQAFLK